MRRFKQEFILIFASLIFASGCSSQLDTLIEVDESQKKMGKELKYETASYERIKKAVSAGVLTEGLDAVRIQKKYGSAVVVLSEEDGSSKWVYKPARESFFTGEKVYLIFNEDDELVSWEQIHPKK
ncbi:MAG: hypothetical protein HQ594_00690 [Candidatus Omnitrophica bacterium]|nr:hypothetical protein [Candidatus Omnitrophota bacterium]